MRFDDYISSEVMQNLLPNWFSPVEEYKALMEAYGGSLDSLKADLEQIYYNFFIQTADSNTLAVWEKLFNLTVSPADPIEYRRERLLQKFNGKVPYTERDLRDDLTSLFGDEYTLTIDNVNSVMRINVTSARYGAFDLLWDLLWDVVPTHIQIIANQQVTNTIPGNGYTASFLEHTYIQTITAGGDE
jgi:hypothetical protein